MKVGEYGGMSTKPRPYFTGTPSGGEASHSAAVPAEPLLITFQNTRVRPSGESDAAWIEPRCTGSGSPPARLTDHRPLSSENPTRLPSGHQRISSAPRRF